MLIHPIRTGRLNNNAYLLTDEASREAVIIDPSWGAEALLNKSKELGLTVTFVLDTHGHPNHAADNAKIVEATGAKLGIHEAEAYRLERNSKMWTPDFAASIPYAKPDVMLKDGSEIRVGGYRLITMHTPGHTEGSICFYEPEAGYLFTGDVIFAGGPGRTDLLGSSPSFMLSSLKRLWDNLPGRTQIFPGHGLSTTLRNEGWIVNLRYPVI